MTYPSAFESAGIGTAYASAFESAGIGHNPVTYAKPYSSGFQSVGIGLLKKKKIGHFY